MYGSEKRFFCYWRLLLPMKTWSRDFTHVFSAGFANFNQNSFIQTSLKAKESPISKWQESLQTTMHLFLGCQVWSLHKNFCHFPSIASKSFTICSGSALLASNSPVCTCRDLGVSELEKFLETVLVSCHGKNLGKDFGQETRPKLKSSVESCRNRVKTPNKIKNWTKVRSDLEFRDLGVPVALENPTPEQDNGFSQIWTCEISGAQSREEAQVHDWRQRTEGFWNHA